MTLLVLLTICLMFGTFEVDGSAQPNIIFILADDLGWDDVSFHGSTQIPTPYLDTLAYDGVILNHYYVQPICTPTRSAIMTGRYPIHTGMQHGVIMGGEPWGLSLEEKLLPQYLNEGGYESHIVGKWHLGTSAWSHTPTARGFSSHYGYQNGASEYYKHLYKDGRGVGLDFFDNHDLVWNETGHYSTEIYAERADRIIHEHDTDKPLFLYLPYQSVHSAVAGPPLEAPQKYINRFKHIKNKNRRMFAAMVSALDDAVGSVLSALEDKNMLANSIIVFSTDNGGPAAGFNANCASNQPLRGVKHTLWEGGTRGAGFVWSPLLSNYGYTSNLLMHCTDWLPTLMAAVNQTLEPAHPLDGINLWDSLSQRNHNSPREEVLLNIDPVIKQSAMRMGNMKILKGVPNTWSDWYPTPTVEGQFERKRVNKNDSEQLQQQTDSDTLYFESQHSDTTVTSDPYANEPEPIPEDLLPVVQHRKWNWDLPVSQEYLRKSELAKSMLQSIGRNVSLMNSGPLIIDCGPRPINATTNCDSKQHPCLFDVVHDPCEYHNLAAEHADIVKKLEDKLKVYEKNMVAPRNQKYDPRSSPKLHGGAWVPWLNDTMYFNTEIDLNRL